MATFEHLQESFVGGEISPRLRGRFGSDLYKVALEECLNFEPLAHGSLRMRAGTEHVRALAGDALTRLAPMRLSSGQDYLIEFLDRKLHLYAISGAQEALSGVPEVVTVSERVVNGNFADGLTGWTAAGNVVFANGRAEVTVSGNNSLRQTVTLPNAADVVFKAKVSPAYVHLRIKVGTTLGGGEALNYVLAPDAVTAEAYEWTFQGLAAGTYYLSIELDEDFSNAWGFPSYVDDVSFKATVASGGSGGGFDIVTPWLSSEVGAVQFVAETGVDRVIFVHPLHPPYFLQRNGAGAWSFDAIPFTATPAEWVAGNYPSVVEIFSGRVYYGATPSERNRFWASRVHDPVAATGGPFDLTTGALKGDALDLTIATKGALRWMQGNRKLLAATDLGEHSVTGSLGIPLVGDVHVRDESAFGSAAIQAVHAGAQALFVSADRRRVRAIAYEMQGDGWESRDVTFLAEHITAGLVKELHFVWAPDGTIVLVRGDGALALCSYMAGEKVAAWWRAPIASGSVASGAVTRGDGGAYLWLAVERGGAMYLERLTLTERGTERYLDASVTGTVGAGGTVGGLAHLNGRSARLLVDGSFAGDFPVENGSVRVDAESAGKPFVAGLPYLARARTLPVEGGNPRGTSQRAKRKWVKPMLRLNDSAPPLVNGRRAAPDRTPSTPMDEAEPRITGDVAVDIEASWDDRGQLSLEQDLPFRTEILALFGSLSVNEI